MQLDFCTVGVDQTKLKREIRVMPLGEVNEILHRTKVPSKKCQRNYWESQYNDERAAGQT